MYLRLIAIVAILCITIGFLSFIVALFTQSYDFGFSIILFAIGLVFFFVAKIVKGRQG
ncbi:hypothetical protein ACFSCX_16125 [Bacillus salitolerans]|uniref:DUF5325 family protein n=1 Tax=Bacillus salitolerans TaxID=1437434 RepID=A0ABW4LSL8_9BACI